MCLDKLTKMKEAIKADCKSDQVYNFVSTIKPPLGLIPKKFRQRERFIEVCRAISGYYNAGKKIPIEWVEEYNELVELCNGQV